MTKITLECGFTAELAEELFDDIELFEKIVQIEKKNLAVLPELLADVLGDDGKERLYNALRDENGKVKLSAVTEAFFEIVKAAGEKK